MIMKKYFYAALLLIFITSVSTQEKQPDKESLDNNQDNRIETQQLPDGFMNLKLGLNMEQLEEALDENSYFDYRGKPDVDMRMMKERSLIECSGFSYIKKGYFQFYKEKLIVITIIIDEKELDYYSFYTKLEKKYGKPDHLNPDGVYWENENTAVALEKPLSVKYTDLKSFDEIKDKFASEKSKQKKLKEEFVDTF